MFCTTVEEQNKFVKCLSPESLRHYFPKNTNPDLDSWTNPANHSMSNKYMPFINNELIELVDPERQMERKLNREKFSRTVDNASKSTENTSKNEVERNKAFLSLQEMMPKTLGIIKDREQLGECIGQI